MSSVYAREIYLKNRTRMKELKYSGIDYAGYFYAVLMTAFIVASNILIGKGMII